MPPYLSPGVYVEEVPPLARPIAGVGTSTPGFIGVIPETIQIPAIAVKGDSPSDIARGYKLVDFPLPPANTAHFVTNWGQYTNLFGDFVGDSTKTATNVNNPGNPGQTNLAQAVYGFFNNGGTGCYVARMIPNGDLGKALKTAFEPIDDISMVAAPGLTDATSYTALIAHCENLKDRVAILDAVEDDANGLNVFATGDFSALSRIPTDQNGLRPLDSEYAAFYFPWLKVFDPATKLMTPAGDGLIYVPPSGHMAGIYASNDATRGVFKAPANEAVLGATSLRWNLSKGDQEVLNQKGVNLIRSLNGAIRVWGARTVGGDDNGDYRYISTRRFFNFVRKSIEQGTQFVVFEPNSPALWKRIIRSVGDFLLGQWREGALFGETPKQAFYVKCDEETNPPDVREAGQVVTEIGIAIVKPAEFVIFRIQQTTGS
jgi:phage tail sheath protein FI